MADEVLLTYLKTQLYQMNADELQSQVIANYADDGLEFLSRYYPDVVFMEPSRGRALLAEYVRYAMSNALDDFTKNYRTELLALSNLGRAKKYAAKQNKSDDNV